MLKQKLATKNKLSQTLRSWLPLLQANIEDLKENLEKFAEENPFLNIEEKAKTSQNGRNFFDEFYKNNANSAQIEARAISKKSVFENLSLQLIPPLFPTKKSQIIAEKILLCLNNEGYFEYEKEILSEFSEDEIERVRARFCYLEPVGVGAKDYKEAFLFALQNENLRPELYEFCLVLIKDFENIQNYTKKKLYKESINILRGFSVPPFLDYFEDSRAIIPDLFILRENGEIKVKINDAYYPEISIQTDDLEHEFLNAYLKHARDLIDALAMRKATLYKIGLMIVEHQYEFFLGENIKPMTLKDLAEDLGYNASTISRAIAGKYLSCERGMIALRNFFAFGLDEEISNASVKYFLTNLIKNEKRSKPLSDSKILNLILKEFKINIGRRTITKYRKQLKIASSSERKKLYELENGA